MTELGILLQHFWGKTALEVFNNETPHQHKNVKSS